MENSRSSAVLRLVRPMLKVAAAASLLALSACASLGASGPSTQSIRAAAKQNVDTANITIIPIDAAVARRLQAMSPFASFADALGDAPAEGAIIGRGDVLQVSIWEAPPAVLFGATSTFGTGAEATGALVGGSVAQQSSLPDMIVDTDGMVRIPFAGAIRAAGRSPREVEREIVARLARKAHQPQVAVRISRNASAAVTLVGDVATNTQVSLTPRGERLLEVIAAAGGVKQPIDKTVIQITRDGRAVTLPLAAVIADPRQNIRLRPNDVVTALSQIFSFTALGETGTTSEVPFESTGITLAQALGRAGGLKSDRADVSGVFIFRLEDPAALDPIIAATARRTVEGRIPVVYAADLKNPANLFVAQMFPIRDKDVLYVSRAPLSDVQRFVSVLASIAFPVLNFSRSVP